MGEKEYLNYLKDRVIKYRKTLNIPRYITFGIEIEYENIAKDTLSHYMEELKYYDKIYEGWKNTSEITIAEYKGCETMNGEVKSPVLKDTLITWRNLLETLNLINSQFGIVTNKCGGHVNIGTQILGEEQENWRNFFLLWILYEKEIYKFSSGEFNIVRKHDEDMINRVAPDLKVHLKDILKNEKMPFSYIRFTDALFDKKHDISLQKVSCYSYKEENVIEFRLPNGTLREEIWQNYINFFVKFLLACKKELDVERTLYNIENNKHSAIELADYVFDDETDKEYFLIQTLKLNKIYKKDLVPHLHY